MHSRSLIQSILGFITLGMITTGCGHSDAPVTPADVTIHVPGLT
jgi:hypothetical protein